LTVFSVLITFSGVFSMLLYSYSPARRPTSMDVPADGSRSGKCPPHPLLTTPAGYIELDAVYVRYAPGRREDAEAAMRRVLQKFDVPEEKSFR